MGRVLIFCIEDKIYSPVLLAKIVAQVRARFSGEYPLVVSQYAGLRQCSALSLSPRRHDNILKSILSMEFAWGSPWTIILFGDREYSEKSFSAIVETRKQPHNIILDPDRDLLAITFSNHNLIRDILQNTVN